MPPFDLTNQNGERISLDTFRGKPFVLTFVFTRCPLPNFCPRMSNNFAELQSVIQAGNGSPAQTHLLSITLDPGIRYARNFEKLRRKPSCRSVNLDLRDR